MNWVLLRNTLLVGSVTTMVAVSFGFIAALWLAGLSPRWRTVFFAAAIVALALPPFLVTNCWLHFLGQTGVWTRWVPLNIFSAAGTIWILSLLLWPLSLLLIWGAWQRLEPAQLESDMLVSGWALLRGLLVPLARGAIGQAALLTFILSANNFAVPAILQVKVFPAEAWVRFNTEFDTIGALQLTWPLAIVALGLLIWFSGRSFPWPHLQPPVSGQLFRTQLGPRWFLFSGACALFIYGCAVVIPLFQIVTVQRTWTELPGALAAGQNAIWNSSWYAAAAATISGALGLFAWVWSKDRNPKSEIRKNSEDRGPNPPHVAENGSTSRVLNSSGIGAFGLRPSDFFRISDFGFRIFHAIAWLPLLLPGVLLGIGLIHAFNHSWSAWFYQSAGIVVLALLIRYFVISWYTTGQAIRRVDPNLTDIASLEGATRWQMLRYVQWPQIARPVLVAWYVIFVLCLWDVESIILIIPPGGETLALRIFNLLHYGHNAQVNALCLTLLLLALVPLLLQSLAKLPRNLLASFALLPLLTGCGGSSGKVMLQSKLFDSVQIVGTRGVGVGQLNKPRSVAVDARDNVYVVDMTGRVQKFSSNGVFVLFWQMPQTDRGKPKGMGRDRDGNIFVVEPHYSRVNLFSPTGRLLMQWGSHGTNAGQFSMPRGVALDSRREIFVSEYQEIERVQRFAFGQSDSQREPGQSPAGLRPPPRWTASFGSAGTAPGELNRAEGICVDDHDRVYVADSCNHRIQVFTPDGNFIRAYGKPGKGLGELSYPYDICVDKEGRQYVCEFGNSRIQVFDSQDHPIELIGGPGAEPGRFNNPWGVALDSLGNLYVADSQNHRVQKLLRRR